MTAEERPPFTDGQVITVFRSRRRAGTEDAYGPLADAMLTAARSQPGFVDFAAFAGDDGERVSIITFATPEAHAAWRDDADHRVAQRRGREELYDEYSIQVGTCTGASTWTRPAD
jgi:heme-degrading monooxygenase HmoA